jgi:hypothetical protein
MKILRRTVVFGCLVWILLPAGVSWGQPLAVSREFKLTASDGEENDDFGLSVAVSGDVIIVGAPLDPETGVAAGSAYVFRFDGAGWAEEAKLVAGIEEGFFGGSVAAGGDVIVVGARGIESEIDGHAFVYRFDGAEWDLQADLVSGAEHDDDFGISVAVSGDIIVVGADKDNHAGPYTGAAYVYRRDGAQWIRQARLTAGDAAENARFGQAVAVDGNVIVIGAYGDGHAGENSGAAYVYRFTGGRWVEEAKLTAGDAATMHNFGHRAVSVDGEVIVVGASGNESAYVFRFDGSEWVEEQRLSNSEAHFGEEVSVRGDVIAVGAFADQAPLPGSGAVYLFRFDGSVWEQQKLTADDAAEGDLFGVSLSLDGDVLVVGALNTADPPDPGAAYVFRISPPDAEPLPPPGDGDGGDDVPGGSGGSGDGCFIRSALWSK